MATYTNRGDSTTYGYDNQLRQVSSSAQPSGSTVLTNTSTYDDAQQL